MILTGGEERFCVRNWLENVWKTEREWFQGTGYARPAVGHAAGWQDWGQPTEALGW